MALIEKAKEQIKYNELHKDEIEKMEQEKEQVRKETNIEKCKTWRNNNADRVKENGKQYYEKNKKVKVSINYLNTNRTHSLSGHLL